MADTPSEASEAMSAEERVERSHGGTWDVWRSDVIVIMEAHAAAAVQREHDKWVHVQFRLDRAEAALAAVTAERDHLLGRLGKKAARVALAEHDRNEARKERDAALAHVDRMLSALNWGLGVGMEFPMKREGQGNYWWRPELQRRAGLDYDGEKFIVAPLTAPSAAAERERDAALAEVERAHEELRQLKCRHLPCDCETCEAHRKAAR